MNTPAVPAGSALSWKTREQMEQTERTTLAPFAQKSGDSRGRQYPEASHSYRTEFQRDRARITHEHLGRWKIKRQKPGCRAC